ncbi:MAG: hypothetical protein KIT14_03160 [bacterium]|nr:hypothetical protein [bacterium]
MGLALLLVLAGEVAAASPDQQCTAAKLKAAARTAAAFARCSARAVGNGTSVDATCLARATAKQAQTFAKAEARGGCPTIRDTAAIAGILGGLVAFADTELGDGGTAAGRRCASSRRTAAGAHLGATLRCRAVRVQAGSPPDAACLDRADAKLARAFAKSGAPGSCATSADAPATRAAMNAVAAGVVAALSPPPTTSTTSTTSSTLPGTSTTSTTIAGTVRFAADVQPIFDADCTVCHTGAFAPVGLDLSPGSSWVHLVGVGSGECPGTQRVAPGSPETSYLMHKLAGSGPCFVGSPMPLHRSPLPPHQQALIATWIAQGAAND